MAACVRKANGSVNDIIHIGWRPMLQLVKLIGKSGNTLNGYTGSLTIISSERCIKETRTNYGSIH